MAEEEKILAVGESQETPHAITITIMDPSALENSALESSLVTTVRAENGGAEAGSVLVVSGDSHRSKDILQTVTETHMGAEELPIISNISNPDHDSPEESADTKLLDTFGDGECEGGEEGEEDELSDLLGVHCLICNMEMPTSESDEKVPVFKTQTTTTHRRLAIFLGTLIGQKLTARKAHSDIMCRRCFSLLDRVDALEVEIRETKDEIVNKYQETVAVHGGRARRRKPALTKKSDYVFPKVEPEDEDDQMLGLETDGTFEPRMEDLMEEEHDRREDNADDEEWEPDFKRPRIKREIIDMDTSGPPKRKRGRPRKDTTRSKDDKQLRSVDEEVGSVDEVATLGTLPLPSPHRQKRRSPRQPCNNNPQAPNCTTDHRLQSLAQLLKVEDFTCDCGVKSTSQMAHMEHILTHVSCAFKCPKCDCSFATSSILVQHQRLVHSPDIPRERVLDMSRPISGAEGEMCSRCGMGVGHDFEVHARSHLYGEYECPVCALRMHTKSTTEMHIERKHPHLFSAFLKNEESLRDGISKSEEGSGTPVSCDVCGKVVATSSRLARHRYLHHPEHYPWPCSDCSLAFSSPDAFNQHVCPHQQKVGAKKTATGQKYECDVCGVMLKSRVNLERHMHSHPDRIGGYHTCPICARTLATRKALTDHLRHHRRQGFSCDFCGAKLKSMDSLNVHINELHTHVVRLQCKHCPQVFFSSGRLSYHVKRHHTDRRSYTNLCHLCGKVYPYPSELRLHLRSHRNERPYKCNQCQKSFLKQGDLTYHKRSHTGERPHKCPHCQATFPRPNTLMSHIRHHHRQSTGVGSTESAPQLRAAQPPAITLPSVPPPAAPHATALVSSAPPHSVAAHPAVVLPPTSVSTANAPTYVTATPATVMAVSSTPYLTPVNPSVPLQPRSPAVTVMSVPGAPRHAHPTLVPMVEGQLVDPTVEGHMTEMQAVQYVQVEGLPGHTTLQPLHPHHPPQGQYTHTQAAVPYQIVHLQILQ